MVPFICSSIWSLWTWHFRRRLLLRTQATMTTTREMKTTTATIPPRKRIKGVPHDGPKYSKLHLFTTIQDFFLCYHLFYFLSLTLRNLFSRYDNVSLKEVVSVRPSVHRSIPSYFKLRTWPFVRVTSTVEVHQMRLLHRHLLYHCLQYQSISFHLYK